MPTLRIVVFTQDRVLAETLASDILAPRWCYPAIFATIEAIKAFAHLRQSHLLIADIRANALLDLLRHLATDEITIPTVLVCPRDQATIPLDYLRFGITTYLYYPFKVDDVLAVVKRALMACERERAGNDSKPSSPQPRREVSKWEALPQLVVAASAKAMTDPAASSQVPLDPSNGGLTAAVGNTEPASSAESPLAESGVETGFRNANPLPEPAVGYLADITGQHLALILENVNDGVWLLDLNLRTLTINSAGARLLGRQPHQLVGRPYSEIASAITLDGSGYHHLKELFEQALQKMASMSFAEGVPIQLPSGRSRTIEGVAIPLLNDGHSAGVACIFREVSIHHNVEQLQAELISMASHNLRTPLTAVQSSLDYMLATQPLTDKGRAVLERAYNQNRQMSTFLRELLEISHLALGQEVRLRLEPTDLRHLLTRITASFQTTVPGLHVTLEAPSELPLVSTDVGKLEIITSHLLDHAARRCRSTGSIRIKVEEGDYQAIIRIIDSGPSLKEHQYEKIFWPIYPLEDSKNSIPFGYAIGLYSVRKLANLMDGDMWVAHHKEIGMCLSFALPFWRKT